MKVLSLVIVSLLLTSCLPANRDNMRKRKGQSSRKRSGRKQEIVHRKGKPNVLNYRLQSQIKTLDPAVSYDTVSAKVIYQAYETLYEYEYLKRPYTLKPLLAVGMPKITDNGKTYTIKIKKYISYHADPSLKGKSRYVTAQDFITQIKRVAFKPTRSQGWWAFDGKIVGLNEFREKAGKDIDVLKFYQVPGLIAINDNTLQIKLTTAYPQLKYILAMAFTSPIPKEAVDYYSNDLSNHVVGTGAFALKKWNRSSSVIMEKFRRYHRDYYPDTGDSYAKKNNLTSDAGSRLPFLDGIHFHIIKESQPAWLNFQAKKLDLLDVPKDNFDTVINPSGELMDDFIDRNIDLLKAETLVHYWFSFNMKDRLLGRNKNLRLAIAHAIDNDRYIELFSNNVALKANSIYVPGIFGYNSKRVPPYSYNFNLAKRYLKKAGYPQGKGLPTIVYDVRGGTTSSRQRAEFVKRELAKIGIKVRVSVNTFPSFLKKQSAGKLQFWQDGWALDYPDAENILQLLISQNVIPGPNATNYSNPKFDALYEKLRVLEDGPEKMSVMQKMEDIIFDDVPWALQLYQRYYLVKHGHLKNYRPSSLIKRNMKYLKLTE
ncbi:MAG: hypothetical protein ISR65_12790 [Bacteriovoracaceae bacterium]|nr:hypothetical protein [Bacteriovoracaceae bacterium]